MYENLHMITGSFDYLYNKIVITTDEYGLYVGELILIEHSLKKTYKTGRLNTIQDVLDALEAISKSLLIIKEGSDE